MTYFEAITDKAVVRRSFKVATIVGTILVAINYGDRLLTLSLQSGDWIKIALTYCVPYCVSTYASVSTMMANVD